MGLMRNRDSCRLLTTREMLFCFTDTKLSIAEQRCVGVNDICILSGRYAAASFCRGNIILHVRRQRVRLTRYGSWMKRTFPTRPLRSVSSKKSRNMAHFTGGQKRTKHDMACQECSSSIKAGLSERASCTQTAHRLYRCFQHQPRYRA